MFIPHDMQVVHLLAAYKEKHRVTRSAFGELLDLLQAVLPPNILPRSFYSYRRGSRAVLTETLGEPGFQRLHMCSNAQCTHLYDGKEERECPKCQSPRFKQLQNGREVAFREVRYMGVQKGVRVMLMSRSVSHALASFDLPGMVDSVHSVYSSRMSDNLCRYFIPEYDRMSPHAARVAKIRFFETGQVCTDDEWVQYVAEVEAGHRNPTKLLMVEGGCDAFQPFDRRVWSTWLMGYRLTGVNWYEGRDSDFEIVTAIASGATEGTAARVVAALDAQDLLQLSPPNAQERRNGMAGVLDDHYMPCCSNSVHDDMTFL
jgi:hypothetical protein